MSLINDALHRAKQNQPEGPAANGPAMHVAGRPGYSDGRGGILMGALIIAVFALSALLLWQWFKASHALEVRAKTLSTPASASIQPATATPAPTIASAPAAPVPDPAPAPAAGNPTVSTAATSDAGSSNTVAAAEAPKPQPVVYKLQSIFYRPTNPSAVINRKTVNVGTRLGDVTISAIDKESVTLRNADGSAQVLELP